MGLVSGSAIIPLYLRNDVVGPMCRSVEDATRVLQVIAGYDPADPLTEHSKGNIPGNYTDYLQKDGMQGARIGVLGILSNDNPDPEIRELFEQAVEDMRSLGAEVINPVDIPRFEELSANQWCSMFKNDVEDYLSNMFKMTRCRLLKT